MTTAIEAPEAELVLLPRPVDERQADDDFSKKLAKAVNSLAIEVQGARQSIQQIGIRIGGLEGDLTKRLDLIESKIDRLLALLP